MEKYFAELLRRYPVLSPVMPEIKTCAEIVIGLFRRGGTLFVAGNGGSGSDAEHICSELLKGFRSRRELSAADKDALIRIDPDCGKMLSETLQYGLPAISLLSHPAFTTAFGNDVDGDSSFAQQLWALGHENDVLLGISTGGNAENIYRAFTAARAKKITAILLTGNGHGRCEKVADLVIAAPESATYRIQELHLPVYHTLCMAVESQFFTMME